MRAVQPPVIPIVAELIARNPGTISLGQGVVHYGPPPEARAAADSVWDEPDSHKYAPVLGIPPLLERVERKLREENGITVGDETALAVTAGGNMAFQAALLALADVGDEVILQTPFYFNHEMAVTIAGCRSVLVETDADYQLRPDAIEAAVTERTRAVVTVSPNNPTGAVYPEAALRAVNDLCARRGLYHIHDEAYETFTFDGAAHFSPGSLPGAGAHTITIHSLSKAYGFAAWRIGTMAVPRALLSSLRKALDTMLICATVASQRAAIACLEAGPAYARPHVEAMNEVRAFAADRFAEVREWCEVPPARGAFYYLLKVRTGPDDMTLTRRLVEEHGVAVVPGSAFGCSGEPRLRVSYGALQPKTAAEGIGRLTEGLRAILGA
jgi:aspartate/methionine/tyrosine aminotransferase